MQALLKEEFEAQPEPRVISVLAFRATEVRKALGKMVRKAKRYGCEDLRVEWGQPYQRVELVNGRKAKVERVDISVIGAAPRVGDYEFVARIDHVEAGAVICAAPGREVDERFRSLGRICEHCKVSRQRKALFVVEEVGSKVQVQVGSNCLVDFVGRAAPAELIRKFAFWKEVKDREDDWSGGIGSSCLACSEDVIELAVTAVRLYGWCSRGEADRIRQQLEDREDYDTKAPVATSDYVSAVISPPSDPAIRKAWKPVIDKIMAERSAPGDVALAAEVLAWVRNEMQGNGDYIYNLRTILKSDLLYERRHLGIAVSAVAAYARAKELQLKRAAERDKAKNSEWVGAVGERLKGLELSYNGSRTVGSGFAYGSDPLRLYKFVDAQGCVFSWFSTVPLSFELGQAVNVTGTVKRHSEYQGAKETQLTRCVVG